MKSPIQTIGIRWISKRSALSLALVIVVFASLGHAQTLTMLYSFNGSADGNGPVAGLVRDSAGNLYGTTQFGGSFSNGVVFKVDTNNNETVLHSFTGKADGGQPVASLLRDGASNLYGTTEFGGSSNDGVVFKLTSAGKEVVLHSFASVDDGMNPVAGLTPDSSGNAYGTSCCGGDNGWGAVFKITSTRSWSLVHSFGSGADGVDPVAPLIRDKAGNLYGTTATGGTSNVGTVFKIDTSGNETILYNFTGGADGGYPHAGLILDAAGNLYGTTVGGGSASGLSGDGVVFKLSPAGQQTVLHTFNGLDGTNPYAGLVSDSAGNLYGTTSGGGTFDWGTVFKLDKTGNETVLYSFTGGVDGSCPMAGLIRDSAGNLYGTTQFGGNTQSGVVFKLTP
jgi:uncharacterized repeat protein (TIGR03803 family)